MEEQAQSLKKKQEQCTQLENSLKECKDKLMASEQHVEQLESLNKVSAPSITESIFCFLNCFSRCVDISPVCVNRTEIGVTGCGVEERTRAGTAGSAETAEGRVRGETEGEGAEAFAGVGEGWVRKSQLKQ